MNWPDGAPPNVAMPMANPPVVLKEPGQGCRNHMVVAGGKAQAAHQAIAKDVNGGDGNGGKQQQGPWPPPEAQPASMGAYAVAVAHSFR